MQSRFRIAGLALGIALLSMERAAAAQDQAKEPPAVTATLQVDVTITRQQGQKVVSSAPYTLLIASATGDRASIRTNLQLPVPSTTTTAAADGKPSTTTHTTRYENIGTSIDVQSRAEGSGRFRITVSINDQAVYPPPGETISQKQGASPPALRSFTSSSSAVLRDGQTTEFTAATDKVTGEVVKIAVKLTILK